MRARLKDIPPERLRVEVGDVTAIDAEDASFDAVFDFAIIHHVPDWRCRRGRDPSRARRAGASTSRRSPGTRSTSGPTAFFMEHPSENRFTAAEFVREVERQGMIVAQRLLPSVGWGLRVRRGPRDARGGLRAASPASASGGRGGRCEAAP